MQTITLHTAHLSEAFICVVEFLCSRQHVGACGFSEFPKMGTRCYHNYSYKKIVSPYKKSPWRTLFRFYEPSSRTAGIFFGWVWIFWFWGGVFLHWFHQFSNFKAQTFVPKPLLSDTIWFLFQLWLLNSPLHLYVKLLGCSFPLVWFLLICLCQQWTPVTLADWCSQLKRQRKK